MSSTLDCPICFMGFDCAAHTPHVAGCGHSICQQCAVQNTFPTCAFCQQVVNHPMAVNFQMRDFIKQCQKNDAEVHMLRQQNEFMKYELARKELQNHDLETLLASSSSHLMGFTCSKCEYKILGRRAKLCITCLPNELVEADDDVPTIDFAKAEERLLCSDCQQEHHDSHIVELFIAYQLRTKTIKLRKELSVLMEAIASSSSTISEESVKAVKIDALLNEAIDDVCCMLTHLDSREQFEEGETKVKELVNEYTVLRQKVASNLVNNNQRLQAVVDKLREVCNAPS